MTIFPLGPFFRPLIREAAQARLKMAIAEWQEHLARKHPARMAAMPGFSAKIAMMALQMALAVRAVQEAAKIAMRALQWQPAGTARLASRAGYWAQISWKIFSARQTGAAPSRLPAAGRLSPLSWQAKAGPPLFQARARHLQPEEERRRCRMARAKLDSAVRIP